MPGNESEEPDPEFKKFASHVPGMIYLFKRRSDGTYCVPFTTDAIRDIFGCSPQDVREDFSPIARVILPEDLEKVVESIEHSAEHLTVWRHEYRVQIPGREIRYMSGHSTPEKLADGGIIWHGYNTDITEIRQKEKALRESEEKYRELVATMSDIVFKLDFDGNVIDTQASMGNIIGTSKEEAIGKRFSDFVHPDDLSRAEEEFIRAIQGKGHPIEIRVISKDGTHRWVRINALVIMRGGEPEDLLCVLSDIHQRKQSEEALRDSEKKYRLLVDSAAEAIMVAQDGMLRLINPETIALTGYTEQDLTSETFEHLIHPDDRAMVIERYLRRLKGEAVTPHYAFRILAKDGSIKWVDLNAVLIEWEGRPATLNFLMDITERKMAEDELRRKTDEAIDARQKRELYFDLLAHDIANIMSPIMSYAELISSDEGTPPQIRQMAEGMVAYTQQATSLIHNLRRLEMLSNLLPSELRPANVKEILIAIEHALKKKYRGMKIDMIVELPQDKAVQVMGGEYAEYIFLSVLDNAIKHAKKPKVTININACETVTESGLPSWEFMIEDDGPGIHENTKQAMMAPLTPDKRFHRGVVSSLTFCRASTVRLGGDFRIENRIPDDRSKGTRIIIRLPKSE